MKKWTQLMLILLLGIAPAAFAGTPASQTNLCGDPALNAIFTANVQAPAPSSGLPFQQPADQPVCQPFCVTSPCQSHDDCTAAHNGRCDFACPQTGCCVYPQ
jgi:hypothetical protein